MVADEGDRLVDRAAGDAGVDRGMDDLRHCAVHSRHLARFKGRDHVIGLDPNLVERHAAAAGRALAKARPIISDRHTRRVRRDESEDLLAVVIDSADRNEMSEERASRVDLFARDFEVVGNADDPRADIERRLAAALRLRVAEPDAA